MSWNRSNRRGGGWGASGASGGAGEQPGTITVLSGEGRFATISAFNDRDGSRVATVTCANVEQAPQVVAGDEFKGLFGKQQVRQTLPIAEAVELAKRWVTGQTIDGGGL